MALADLAIIGGSWWLIHEALQSQTESEHSPCEIFQAKPRGRDPELRQVHPWEDLGPFEDAYGLGKPLPGPEKPVKKPKNWDKMSRWQKIKWWLKYRLFWGSGHIITPPR